MCCREDAEDASKSCSRALLWCSNAIQLTAWWGLRRRWLSLSRYGVHRIIESCWKLQPCSPPPPPALALSSLPRTPESLAFSRCLILLPICIGSDEDIRSPLCHTGWGQTQVFTLLETTLDLQKRLQETKCPAEPAPMGSSSILVCARVSQCYCSLLMKHYTERYRQSIMLTALANKLCFNVI